MVPSSGRQMIGRLLDGKYRLEELCGRGGMGAVYRALHVGTGRRVAVKVIAPELAGNREFIERFRREAKTIGRLRHPNIVNVTDFGITGENEHTLAYLVMEHLEGVTLAAKLKDKRPLPLADALDILSQTCAAIDEAHRLGILHRDLKPENIWLEPVRDGGCNVKVLDFGIAQLHDLLAIEEPELLPVIGESSAAPTSQPQPFSVTPFSITEDETLRLNLTLQQLTRMGAVMGTPKYMSPEQCRGEKLDNASDIYSLGVIAYQMLSGPAEIRRWADSLLIVPPLLQEDLSIDEAAQRSARLVAPLRRKLAYPFFRRLLAFALVLTMWQVMLVIWGNTLDGGRRFLAEALIFRFPLMLAFCFTAFSLSLKSSIEQAALYLTARQALGEITAEEAGLPYRQDVEAGLRGWWLSFKTYAPTCALLLLMGYLQFQKFPLMSGAINSRDIYTVKALQAAGVPLPFWSLPGVPPTGFRRWLRRALLPFGQHSFQPYGPRIVQSQAMTKFLLEKGVDVNARLVLEGRGWTPPRVGYIVVTPLHVALTDGRVEIARMMIAHGADAHALDSLGRTPLIVAITYCPQAIELLLASGVDINEQTRFGAPLLAAARYQWLYIGERRIQERENAVKILLEKGADPNARDSDGRNALMVMSMEHRSDGANFNIKRRRRPPPPPPKSGAPGDASDGPLELIGEALLQAGCDVNAADINGRTPLMYAAWYREPIVVRLLLKGGANVKAKDKDGKTALDLAKQFNNQEVIKLLQLPHVQSGNGK
ncbi:MAG TPA: ankyrin repeat domain-containing protein [Blastocatellia bacterium]|nr:ankyrin repeat domain-containing protein [Blastocatellia bacterium]